MNTDRLAKHYASLTPAERLSLILAASARGDEQEWDRLGATAPRLGWQLPHHFGLAMAFLEVSATHRMELLNLAALYFHSFGEAGAAGGEPGARLLDSAMLFGYLLKVHLAGQRMFCAERNLASGAGDFAEAARRSGALLPAHHGDGPLMLVLSRASPMLMQGGAGFDPVWEPPGKCAARNWTERVVRLG